MWAFTWKECAYGSLFCIYKVVQGADCSSLYRPVESLIPFLWLFEAIGPQSDVEFHLRTELHVSVCRATLSENIKI